MPASPPYGLIHDRSSRNAPPARRADCARTRCRSWSAVPRRRRGCPDRPPSSTPSRDRIRRKWLRHRVARRFAQHRRQRRRAVIAAAVAREDAVGGAVIKEQRGRAHLQDECSPAPCVSGSEKARTPGLTRSCRQKASLDQSHDQLRLRSTPSPLKRPRAIRP